MAHVRRRRRAADHPRRARLDEALRRPSRGLQRGCPCRPGHHRRRDRRRSTTRASAASRLLQDALSEGAGNKLVFYAFDLLYLDGWDLPRRVRCSSARRYLSQLLRRRRPAARRSSSATMSRATARRSTSGRPNSASKASSRSAPTSAYQSGRTNTWTKTKALQRRRLRHRRLHHLRQPPKGSAALGARRMGRRRAAIPRQGRHRLRQRHCRALCSTGCEPLRRRRRPARRRAEGDDLGPAGALARKIHYANRTTDNSLRHAVFKGLRDVELSTPASRISASA